MSSLHAIVLAAGKGTRMRSDSAKVLQRAAGRTLLDWVLEALAVAQPDRTLVVVGHRADEVSAQLADGVEHVVQEPQDGTGHAVQVALAALGRLPDDDTVLVAYGDMPLVPPSLFAELAGRSLTSPATIVTVAPGPDDFGRIIRDQDGRVTGIVERRDCDPVQVAVEERNVGLYSFAAGALTSALAELGTDNSQGELYLTDVIARLAAEGPIETVSASTEDVIGVNSHADLAQVQSVLRARINGALMTAGVWILDPARTYVDASVTIEAGACLYPGTHLEGDTVIAAEAVVGPDSLVRDSTVGPGARVMYSVLRGAEVGAGAEVGPYASLRPGSVLEPGSKVGTFVETKNTRVREGAKIPHLSYMGDADVGAGANVGAGSITCNYDGYEKHETVIGEGAFIGSDTMLVAPVRIGRRAVTGAGSVITSDVEDGALALERSPQKEVPGYAERRAARQRAQDDEGN